MQAVSQKAVPQAKYLMEASKALKPLWVPSPHDLLPRQSIVLHPVTPQGTEVCFLYYGSDQRLAAGLNHAASLISQPQRTGTGSGGLGLGNTYQGQKACQWAMGMKLHWNITLGWYWPPETNLANLKCLPYCVL